MQHNLGNILTSPPQSSIQLTTVNTNASVPPNLYLGLKTKNWRVDRFFYLINYSG